MSDPKQEVQPQARGWHEKRVSRSAHKSWQTGVSPLILQKDFPGRPSESRAKLAFFILIQKGSHRLSILNRADGFPMGYL